MTGNAVDDGNLPPSAGASKSPRGSHDGSMLNVLARAADEMPLRNDAPPDTPGSSCLFDRKTFLDLFQRAARTLDPDPYAGISVLEQGLEQLLAPDDIPTHQLGDQAVHARIDQPRRDLKDTYDILTAGLMSVGELKDLFEVYWSRCNPLIRLLDPTIYTLDATRSRSALLLTAMCQVAAQSLPESGHSLALCTKLDQHIEYLAIEMVKYGYQSIEICQGLVIYAAWLRGTKQQQTWQIMSQAMTMAIELRLDSAASLDQRHNDHVDAKESAHRATRNQQRTWMVMVEWDRVMAFIRGRRPLLRASLTRTSAQSTLTDWWKDTIAIKSDVMLCAALQLRETISLLQRSTHEALLRGNAIDFSQYQNEVDTRITQWQAAWFQHLSEEYQTRAAIEVKCIRFVLLMTPFESRLNNEDLRGTAKDECLVAGVEVCKAILPLLDGTMRLYPTRSIMPMTLYLIGYTAFCSLRIMVTTAAGLETPDINVEAFHLAILAAVASRLCNLKIHPHLAAIAHGLGLRLLNASRKFAARRLSKQADPSDGDRMDEIFSQVFAPPELAEATFGQPHVVANGNADGMIAGDFAMSFDFSHFGETFPFLEQGGSGMAQNWDDPFGFQIPYQ